MKSLIVTILFAGFIGFGASAQTATIPGGAPQDIIFLGYENIVFVKDNEGLKRKFNVRVEGGEVSILQANDGTTNQGRYKVSPSATKNVVLIITDNEGNEMNRYDYNVSRLPDTQVQFATTDGKFSMDEPKLVLKSAYAFLEKSHEIVSWSVEKEGSEIGSGKGSEIDMMTMGQLSLLSSGTTFDVKAVLIGMDGISRIRTITCTK